MPLTGPLTPEEIQNAKELFAGLDTDGDGKISSSDLVKCLTGAGFELSEDDCKALIARADLDGSGTVNAAEFMKVCERRPIKTRIANALRELFNSLDTDNSGYITLDNLKTLIRDAGYESQMSEAELKELIGRVDKSGDGKVSFEEFVDAFMA